MSSARRDFGYFASSFLGDYLTAKKGCSARTVASYRDAMVLLIEFIAADGAGRVTFADLTRERFEAFLDHLEQDRGNSVATRNQRQAALNSFFGFVRTREPSLYAQLTEIMEIPRKKSTRPAIEYLTVGETEALFASVDESTREGLRDKAMLSFLYETAARVGELTGFLTCQLRFDAAPYVELRGKGGKTRNVPVTKSFVSLIEDYMDAYDVGVGDDPLFFNRYGMPLSQRGVSYVLEKYLGKAAETTPSIGRKHVTCHGMRHSRAVHLLEAGVNLVYIRDVLGHASVTTTEIYARTSPELKRKLLEQSTAAIGCGRRYSKEERDDLICWLKETF